MSIEINNRYANIAAGILDKARRDLGTDEECVIRDLVTALMHYAARDGQDAIEEVRWGIWHWYDEHANPDNIADQDPEHIKPWVTIRVRRVMCGRQTTTFGNS